MKRYDFDELTIEPSHDGEWVRAEEAMAIEKNIGWLEQENAVAVQRIAALERMVETMKCCGNCKHGNNPESHACRTCDEEVAENWAPRQKGE